ncbi:syntaxin [Acrasis kona]|uniref:Syntaxin n=1 Tax=Acrasis kona TaxID=1008807 RepID=A0AAW2ZFJ8_9EUKA
MSRREIHQAATDVAENDDFELQRCTPGMADLMLRLYDMRVDCGAVELEEMAAQQAKRQLMTKMDDFEIKKVNLDKLLRDTKNLLDQKESGTVDDLHLNSHISGNLVKIDKLMKTMKQMVHDSSNGENKWAILKQKVPQEIIDKRKEDYILIKKHVDIIKQRQEIALGMRARSKGSSAKGFTAIEDLKNKEKEIPTIDITDGLKQIEDRKLEQDKLLSVIDGQLNQIGGIAKGINSELDLHAKMIDRLDDDALKYKDSLSSLNSRVEKAIEQTGGGPKYILGAILSVIALIVFLALIVAIKNLVR